MRLRSGMLFVIWIVWGGLLALLAVSAWLFTDVVWGWIGALQRTYAAGPDPGLLMRADAHVHLLVSFLGTLWFGLGCRLFAPRLLPWVPVALMVLVALFDELAQIGSASRTFQWNDQIGDAIGIGLALPLLCRLRRLDIQRPGAGAVSPAGSPR